MTNRKSFTNFKTFITKNDKKLVRDVTDITKGHRIYYKLRQLLQSLTFITDSETYHSLFWVTISTSF